MAAIVKQIEQGSYMGKIMPTVKGRWANLMCSQRNNPYCDLLEIRCKYTNYFLIQQII